MVVETIPSFDILRKPLTTFIHDLEDLDFDAWCLLSTMSKFLEDYRRRHIVDSTLTSTMFANPLLHIWLAIQATNEQAEMNGRLAWSDISSYQRIYNQNVARIFCTVVEQWRTTVQLITAEPEFRNVSEILYKPRPSFNI